MAAGATETAESTDWRPSDAERVLEALGAVLDAVEAQGLRISQLAEKVDELAGAADEIRQLAAWAKSLKLPKFLGVAAFPGGD